MRRPLIMVIGDSTMPYHSLENELRGKARELITQGRLPCYQPTRMWGGNGTGQLQCSLCDRPIGCDEVEYEIEHDRDGSRLVNRFHFLCHAAWQMECAREQTMRKSSP
jgi:hypothetical protein